ncbi:hypothetical protein [Arenibacter sp. H213]|uniref:Uncharacterized protein n=1 Tax=Arenibacter antarcticus TaxID=2040469 RepID=A0ABW5VJB5_9FLAO|nr:hypothetical protein [Arenibacter sp. H213]
MTYGVFINEVQLDADVVITEKVDSEEDYRMLPEKTTRGFPIMERP